MASQGDPRVLFALNAVLSSAFAAVVVFGLAFVGLLEFAWTTVALAASGLMLLTWVMVLR
jgi:hypothetical protein